LHLLINIHLFISPLSSNVMAIIWPFLIPLSLVSAATYDFAWDAKELEYTCEGLKEQTGKQWEPSGDLCVHFSDDRYSWSNASKICATPSFSSSNALSELSWLKLRIIPESTEQYWTALKFQDAETLLDGLVSTSIYNPSWADTEPTSFDDDCVALDLSSKSSKLLGWHFEQCSTKLPVICQTFACIGDEFRCADNTRCIPKAAVNDGFEDCLDGSDEYSSGKLSTAFLNVSRAGRLARDRTRPAIKTSDDASISAECPLPQNLRDSWVVAFSGYDDGDTIMWKCNSGFAPRDQQYSVCEKSIGWYPPIQCNKFNCFEPETRNLTHFTGTLHGDRAFYATFPFYENKELTRVAVCDEGTWVYMNDELENMCVAGSFYFGHFTNDKYAQGDLMDYTCEKDFNSSIPAPNCDGAYASPMCSPDTIKPADCDGVIHKGPPLFERDWCACTQGGVMQDGECKGFTDGCSANQDTCSVGKLCTRNETAGEDYHCECPPGTCLYPFNECATEAFLGEVDKNMGECATLRCPIEDLKVPSNCRITTYDNAIVDVDMRLGYTDVICIHDAGAKKIQTRHKIRCVNGQWEVEEFNKKCNSTKGMIYQREQYDAFETASVYYSGAPSYPMSIMCNGNGEWLGEVPVDTCVNGTLRPVSNVMRCICDDGYYGVDCSKQCNQGNLKSDGLCECFPGFHGQHCEITEQCENKSPEQPSNGENIDLVFIIDLYKDGMGPLLTNTQTGLISGIQQLIRDVSYYDNEFVRNVVLIPFGTPTIVQAITIPWAEVGNFVDTLFDLQTQIDNTCQFPPEEVLGQIAVELKGLARGSIVNMLTVQPTAGLVDSIIDVFVSNALIANIITDSSVTVTGCKSSGGAFTDYFRLAKLTGGYYLDGMGAASFMQILPRFFKSSMVLIPALLAYDSDDPSPFVLDSAAQSIIAYAYDETGRSGLFGVKGLSNPDSFEIGSNKVTFQVLHNHLTGKWQSVSMMDGYYYQSVGKLDWDSAVSACEAIGGTVADFLNSYVCPSAVDLYWLPIRVNPDDNTYIWEATYRGTKIPMISPRFGGQITPPSGADCAAINCKDFTWVATPCNQAVDVLCQKSVFDTQKTASLPSDDIRTSAEFTLNPIHVSDGAWFSVRVQSNILFDYKMADMNGEQVATIKSGSTQLRMSVTTGSGGADTNAWASYASVIDSAAITRSPGQLTACPYFSMSTVPLFCRSSDDVTVQISNNEGVIRSFVARCSESLAAGYAPPPDCASTGCVTENTSYCYIDQSRVYKCSCLSGYEGDFCEIYQMAESTCEAKFQTALNEPSIDSTIITSGCGCTPDMVDCSFNRDDPCDNRCSADSKCQFIDIPSPTFKSGSPSTFPNAVAACVCNPGFAGEFCDRKEAHDCSSKPCHNGAKCEDHQDPTGFTCVCAEGYTGEFCDIPLGLCTDTTCENGGTCYNLDPLSTFCLCPNGYAGNWCERMLDLGCFNGGNETWDGRCDCTPPWTGRYCTMLKDPMPVEVCGCSDGATCVYDVKQGMEQTSCKCPANVVGDKCEMSQAPCALFPCGLHGTCVPQANGHDYKCQCDYNYAGDLCDVYVGDDGCQADTCLNGGSCEENVCVCPSPYTGTHCQETLPCKDYCLNGGTCVEVEDKPVCQCPLRNSGKQCEKEDNDKTYNILISPAAQNLGFDVQNLNPIFSVCCWVRPTPKRAEASKPVMPIFEFDFGGDNLRVTTANATIRGQSLGDFNLRMQVWQQFCVRCNAVKCDAFANGVSLGVNLMGGFTHSSSQLTLAPTPAKNEIMLNGEISRFSIYNRAINDSEVAAFTFDCASTVGTDETADALWWSLLDQIRPRSALVSPGLCESSTCLPGACGQPNHKSPPIATSCPSDMFLNSSRPMVITWKEPMFEDDVAVTKIESNYRSGDIFVWGEHHVVYTATDSANNTGRCEFDIYFAPYNCTQPKNPSRGAVLYQEAFDGESGCYSMASVQCDDVRFPLDGPKFYVCDYMGQWRRSYYSPSFTLPSCGKVSEPKQTIAGKVQFELDGYNCDQDRKKIIDTIDDLLSQYCPNGLAGCVVVTVTDCPKASIKSQRADDEAP
ncbi:hypothetical protein PENTCL1PPCAC_11038, partial [Pristionchus entomophagus]